MTRPQFTVNSKGSGQTLVSSWIKRSAWIVVLMLLPCLWQPPMLASGQQIAAANPYRVEAAFLRNFAHYVTWPPQAFDQDSTPWHIGILGPDPFRDFLELTFEGRTEQGRSFKIFRASRLDQLPPCHIVFIAFQNAVKRRAALNKLKDRPVLTVGEASDFLKEGGIIRFQVGDRVGMSVNLDQARSSSLSIQTKMLEVSDKVLENGVVRNMR
ncbi:MAG: YfiR family protein [Desulfobacteraceae bacterium]